LSADAVKLPGIQQATTPEIEEPLPVDPRPETPSNSQPPSEEAPSTTPTTPASISIQQQVSPTRGDTTPVVTKSTHRPAVPIIPAVPKSVSRETRAAPEKSVEATIADDVEDTEQKTVESEHVAEEKSEEVTPPTPAPKAWSQPKAWGGVFKTGSAVPTAPTDTSRAAVTSFGKTNAESLSEAVKTFSAEANDAKVAFLEPRGLVNTGNMCYMNSVSILNI
jgi:ubiquitin carboxyl-terminal hydrolase 10